MSYSQPDRRPQENARVSTALAPDIAVVIDHAEQMRRYSPKPPSRRKRQAERTRRPRCRRSPNRHRFPANPALQLAQQIMTSREPCASPGCRHTPSERRTLRAAEGRDYFYEKYMAMRRGYRRPLETARNRSGHPDWRQHRQLSGAMQASPKSPSCRPDRTLFMDEPTPASVRFHFVNAMTVLATVISATHADRVTVDAGFKAFSTDRPFGPRPVDPSTSGATNGQATSSATSMTTRTPTGRSRAIHSAALRPDRQPL